MQGLLPAEGGGYVFAVELLKALNRLRGSTSHELMLCWRGGAPESVMALHDFPVLDLDAHRASVLTTRERISERVPNIINRIAHFALPAPKPTPTWDERVLRRAGIEFV